MKVEPLASVKDLHLCQNSMLDLVKDLHLCQNSILDLVKDLQSRLDSVLDLVKVLRLDRICEILRTLPSDCRGHENSDECSDPRALFGSYPWVLFGSDPRALFGSNLKLLLGRKGLCPRQRSLEDFHKEPRE